MTTVNAPSFVYPHFHDVQSTRKTKDIEIDNSVYHLLSLYLNADALEKMTPNTMSLLHPPTTAPHTIHHKKHSPYWRTKSNRISKGRNWFGEEIQQHQDTLLESNTIKNATTPVYNDDCMTNRKKRSKSVSFNETVTIIISQDNTSVSPLKEDDEDESLFVDAVESFD